VSAPSFDRARAVAAWSEAQSRAALTAADQGVVAATTAARSLVVDLALRAGQDEELYDACAVLGRLLAEGGASPSLAALSIDHACEALGERAPAWATPARAALMEGFVRARVEAEREAGCRGWDYPACAVVVDETTLAIAAGYPSDDEESLASWAARTARSASYAGFRRALVSGRDHATAALAEALGIVGIDCVCEPKS
jgi:hypothetical protein